MQNISIIIPALNEAESLVRLIPELRAGYPEAEIIVVNDGSSDNTKEVLAEYSVKSVTHPYSMGNGAAIKSGARHATGDYFLFMDADGQHDPSCISKLIDEMDKGYDMVVGAREMKAHAGMMRYLANTFYNHFATWVTGHKVVDLTSGFRLVRAEKFMEFIYMLPNGFSYPTTITMAFFRSGYTLSYINVDVQKRVGRSHIRPIIDGLRFMLIIFKIGTLYAPLKIFAPASFLLFGSGIAYYLYTFISQGRFTNMGMLILLTAIILFFVGLISEQLTVLMYSSTDHRSK